MRNLQLITLLTLLIAGLCSKNDKPRVWAFELPTWWADVQKYETGILQGLEIVSHRMDTGATASKAATRRQGSIAIAE